jgi:hypothetical protein
MSKPHSHETAETLIHDGTWKLMFGPVDWAGWQSIYFLHHDCTIPRENGDSNWVNWYIPDLKDTDEEWWCQYCKKDPPVGIRAMLILMRST